MAVYGDESDGVTLVEVTRKLDTGDYVQVSGWYHSICLSCDTTPIEPHESVIDVLLCDVCMCVVI